MSRLRWLTAGESHGPALVATLEGLPAGVPITTEMVADAPGPAAARLRPRCPDEVRARRGHLPRRRPARPHAWAPRSPSWSATPSGPSGSRSWRPTRSTPEILAELARNAPLTRPRPGHADLAGMQKYGFDEARPILERASARETAARVALGAVARSYLKETAGIEIVSPRRRAGRGQGALRRPTPSPPTSTRLDADPVRCLDADASEGDGRGDRPGPQGRRHPRRRRRGAGVRRAGGPRLARPLGPPARRPAGRRPHGHPGDQGRRGRRRLRPGAGARFAGARRDRAHRRRHPALHRPLRRHRGRSDHRRAAAGARRDEADRDRAAGAGHRRRRPPARPPRPTTSAPTSARCPAAGIVAEAMVALVLADAVAEKFGGDSVPRDPPQRAGPTSTTWRSGDRGAASGRAGRPDGRRQVHGGRAARRAAGLRLPGHRRRHRRRGRAAPSPRSSSTRARPHFRAIERTAVREALAEPRRRARARRRRDPRRRHPRAARRPAGRLPLDGRRGGGPAHRPERRPPAARRQPAPAVARADGAPAATCTPRSRARSWRPTAAPPKRSPKPSSTHWS